MSPKDQRHFESFGGKSCPGHKLPGDSANRDRDLSIWAFLLFRLETKSINFICGSTFGLFAILRYQGVFF